MTDTEPPIPPQNVPPTAAVDPLDERLSAALDGEAEQPAPDALTRARRRDLEAARDLLAVAPPPLDAVTRARLLRAAVAGSPTSARPASERSLHRLRIASVAAAVLVAVALAGLGLASLDHSSSKNSSAEKSASAATAPSGPLDLHEVSNPSVLRSRVEAALASAPTTAVPSPGTASATTAVGAKPTPQARCVSTVRVPAGDTPELLGTATFHGAPALVVVARDQSRVLVFVLATADCRLLSSQFLRQ